MSGAMQLQSFQIFQRTQSSEHKVQWNKYRAWGGKDAVMNMKFDAWWEEHWKDCFGIDEERDSCKYPINGNPKADGIRYALLVYENLHRGSNWDIAIHIQKEEMRNWIYIKGRFTALIQI